MSSRLPVVKLATILTLLLAVGAVQARFDNGVLTVTLPKVEHEEMRYLNPAEIACSTCRRAAEYPEA